MFPRAIRGKNSNGEFIMVVTVLTGSTIDLELVKGALVTLASFGAECTAREKVSIADAELRKDLDWK